jgi:hypothetical protein
MFNTTADTSDDGMPDLPSTGSVVVDPAAGLVVSRVSSRRCGVIVVSPIVVPVPVPAVPLPLALIATVSASA